MEDWVRMKQAKAEAKRDELMYAICNMTNPKYVGVDPGRIDIATHRHRRPP